MRGPGRGLYRLDFKFWKWNCLDFLNKYFCIYIWKKLFYKTRNINLKWNSTKICIETRKWSLNFKKLHYFYVSFCKVNEVIKDICEGFLVEEIMISVDHMEAKHEEVLPIIFMDWTNFDDRWILLGDRHITIQWTSKSIICFSFKNWFFFLAAFYNIFFNEGQPLSI